MINAQDLSDAFARNVMVIKSQAEGLTHEDSLRQLPSGNSNCLNWVLGHIAANRDAVLKTLGEEPVMGANGVRNKRGSDPVTAADEEGIQPLQELLNYLERTQERIAAALSKVNEDALSRELTPEERYTQRTMTVGQQAFFLYFHESYHVGQTELFRQLAGKNDKII